MRGSAAAAVCARPAVPSRDASSTTMIRSTKSGTDASVTGSSSSSLCAGTTTATCLPSITATVSACRQLSAPTGCRGGRSRSLVADADGDDAARAEAVRRLEGDQPGVLGAELAAARRAEGERPRHALLGGRHGIALLDAGVARRLAHEVGPRIEREVDEQDRQAGDDGRGDPVQAPLELPDRVDQARERDVHPGEVSEGARDDDPEHEEEPVDRVADRV